MNNLQLDRNIVTYIIGMSLIASLLPLATGGPTITTIQMNDVELAYNGTNICDLSALNIENLGSLQINITWDTTVVDLERVIKADLNIANYMNHEMGYVNITGYELSAKTGSFTIASFEFKAKGASGTTCDLDINYCELLTADPQPEAPFA